MTFEEAINFKNRIKETVFNNLKTGQWTKDKCVESRKTLSSYRELLSERELLYDEKIPDEVVFGLSGLRDGIEKFELWQKYNHSIESTKKPNTQTQKVILKQLLPGVRL